jgi:hypothetical protein
MLNYQRVTAITSKITISRSWSPAKSSMPVGVIEKDTVLFAVPKKGRTSCGET